MPKKLTINPGDKYGNLTIVREIARSKTNKKMVLCVCDCGNEHAVQFYNLTTGHVWRCKQCYLDSKKELIKPNTTFGNFTFIKELPQDKSGNRIIECKCICGNLITGQLSLIKHGYIKQCATCSASSDITGQMFGRLYVISKAYQHRDSGRWHYLCHCVCGTYKIISGHLLLNNSTLSCTCLQRELSSIRGKLRTGINHPNYKGLTKDNRHTRQVIYRCLSTQIQERDNYTCYKCKSTDTRFHIHHIYNFADYVDLRDNSFNLVTLCKECHKLFHITFGYKYTTLEQFEEFIGYKYKYRQSLLNYYEYYH